MHKKLEKKMNLIIPLDEKSELVLIDILKKYEVQESEDEMFEKIKKSISLNKTLTIKLVRDLLNENISNKGFLDALHKELKLPKEKTKELALDIINNLVPLLEKIPEDKLKEYNRKKQLENTPKENDGQTTQEKLVEKLKATVKIEEPKQLEPEDNKAQPPKNPPAKKLPVLNVEENATAIEEEKEKPPKIEDKYREPID